MIYEDVSKGAFQVHRFACAVKETMEHDDVREVIEERLSTLFTKEERKDIARQIIRETWKETAI